MSQIWDCNIFSQEMMPTWGQWGAALKTYGHAVTYFNDKTMGIKQYEASSGNMLGQNVYSQANAVQDMTTKIVTSLEDLKVPNNDKFNKRDTIIINTVNEFRTGQSKLRSKLAD